jgi:hypothetical protein
MFVKVVSLNKNNMLSKIVQESVEKFDEQFKSSYAYPFVFNEDVKQFLISSQISLLQAELERKKRVIEKAYLEFLESESIIDGDEERQRQKNILGIKMDTIVEDITYLTEQIEEIKKLV